MPAAVEQEQDLLFAFALGGPLALRDVVWRLGEGEAEVERLLGELQRRSLIERSTGDRHVLTSEGRARFEDALAIESGALRQPLAVLEEPFASRNSELKELLYRWQVRKVGDTDVPNDHSDPAHDAQVLRELGRWRARGESLLAGLAALRTRYARYRSRLDAALAHVGRGEIAYVSGLAVDSLHGIWWQLHAELLAILGRRRSESDA